jgi:hypothetical protein
MIEEMADALSNEQRETIELSFPAHPDLVVLARFAAATVAARAGFDVEEIEDLRLAVDELCVSFGPMAEDGCLRMELGRFEETVSIVGSFEPFSWARSVDQEPKDSNWERAAELSELLLDSLVDEHGRETRNGRSVAWLRKRRASAR